MLYDTATYSSADGNRRRGSVFGWVGKRVRIKSGHDVRVGFPLLPPRSMVRCTGRGACGRIAPCGAGAGQCRERGRCVLDRSARRYLARGAIDVVRDSGAGDWRAAYPALSRSIPPIPLCSALSHLSRRIPLNPGESRRGIVGPSHRAGEIVRKRKTKGGERDAARVRVSSAHDSRSRSHEASRVRGSVQPEVAEALVEARDLAAAVDDALGSAGPLLREGACRSWPRPRRAR